MRLDHHTVRVGDQHRVAGGVARDAGLGLGRLQLGPGGLGGRLDLVVGRARDRAGRNQIPVAGFVSPGLVGASPGGGYGLVLSRLGQNIVGGIDAHQRLPPPDRLAGVDQALNDLAGDPEAELAFDARRDDAGELSFARLGRASGRHAHDRGLGPGVDGGVMAAAGDKRRRQAANEGGEDQTMRHSEGSGLEWSPKLCRVTNVSTGHNQISIGVTARGCAGSG